MARSDLPVGVRDDAKLRLKPTKKARALLDGRDVAVARLRVVVTDASGKRSVFGRSVRLFRNKRKG